MSVTSTALVASYLAYEYYKSLKRRIERLRRRLEEGKTAGKYFRIYEIHGEREEKEEERKRRERRREEEINLERFVGYIDTPEGKKLKTPLFEINVEYIPRTTDSVMRLAEYPVRVYSSVIEASTPLFRQDLARVFRSIRRFKERIEGG